MLQVESLHTHTTLSDGKLSHNELFLLAESLGIAVLAFTDHDAVPPPAIMAELEALRGRATKWVVGIEITAGLPRELLPQSASMHIIGLFVDPANEALMKHCKLAQDARIRRMQKIVENLQALGFKITEEDCFEMSGGESVGRPHVVRALARYPENNLVTEKIRKEMAVDTDPVAKKRYKQMMERGGTQYPYALFLSQDAYRKGYVEHDYLPNLDEAVALIRNAGGVAVLAHYFTIRSKMSLEALDRVLREKRLDGVEVVYGLREYGTIGEKEMKEEREALRAMAKKYDLLSLGGSDAHSKEELEHYVASEWFSRESVGFTAKITDTGKANKKFSSLE